MEIISNNPEENKIFDPSKSKEELEKELLNEILNEPDVSDEEIIEDIKSQAKEIKEKREQKLQEQDSSQVKTDISNSTEENSDATNTDASSDLDPIELMVQKAKEEKELHQQTKEANSKVPTGGLGVTLGVDNLIDEDEIEKPVDPLEALIETKQQGAVLEVDDETAKMLEIVGDVAQQAQENEQLGVDDPNKIIDTASSSNTNEQILDDSSDEDLIDTSLANSMVDDFFDGEEIETPNVEEFFAKEEEEAKKELTKDIEDEKKDKEINKEESKKQNDKVDKVEKIPLEDSIKEDDTIDEIDDNSLISEDIHDFDVDLSADEFEDDSEEDEEDEFEEDEDVDLSTMNFKEKLQYKVNKIKRKIKSKFKSKKNKKNKIKKEPKEPKEELSPEEKKKRLKKIIIIFVVILLIIGGVIAGLMYRPIHGILSIKFKPDIAKITLNGKEILDTSNIPIEENIKYKISISAQGYVTKTDTIEYSFTPKEKLNINLRKYKISKNYTLSKKYGKIKITSSPSGADIFISDENIHKKTPATLKYEIGSYDVRVRKRNYKLPHRKSVKVKYNKTTNVDFKLQRKEIKVKKKIILPDPIVSVKSFPRAKLYLDGKLKGETPISFTVKKSKRNKVYKIRLEAKGYKTLNTTISVRKDTEVSYTLEEKRLGWLTVKSVPTGAFVYINGETITTKKTNLEMYELREGKYKLRLSKGEIYKDITDTFNINKGEETKKMYVFKFKKGSLSISSNPSGATIFLNGKDTRLKTPQILDLTIGEYQVEVKKDGFARSIKKTVNIKYQETTDLNFELIQGEKIEKSFFIEPAMVKIDKGTLILDNPNDKFYFDENPKHIVHINKDFYIAKNEVTFEEYDMYCYLTGARIPDDNGFRRGKIPVVNISWYEAKSYANWLSQMSGKHYSLPTEAQWRYVAQKAGMTGLSWFAVNSGGHPHLVGSKRANSLGLYDFYGNVWEWAEDWYKVGYKSIPSDGSANTKGDRKYKIIVGGGYNSDIEDIDLYNRTSVDPLAQESNIGFRLVCEVK